MKDANSQFTPLLWNTRTAAQALGISERTLWTLTKAGTIPHVPIGHRVLYDPKDLEAWIDRNKCSFRNETPAE